MDKEMCLDDAKGLAKVSVIRIMEGSTEGQRWETQLCIDCHKGRLLEGWLGWRMGQFGTGAN